MFEGKLGVSGFVRAIVCGFGCSLALYCSFAYANKPITGRQDTKDVIPFSLAISGGISLGSYEAGLNWALVKYLKTRRTEIISNEPDKLYPELTSSVGASAGSINALISAIEWCVDDSKLDNGAQHLSTSKAFSYRNNIHHNLFRTLWLNVGIDEMLPAGGKDYREGDGILTRAAFDRAIHEITETLKSDIFRADCNLPLGMIVTRVDPVTMSIAGVEVENQRFMIPVRLQSVPGETNTGRIEIVSHLVNQDDPFLGNVMYLRQSKLAGRQRYVIEPEHLINAILTSSAYPIAFGKIALPHCAVQEANDKTAMPYECPPGYYPRVDNFIDGGVFDNVPLGIAKSLAEPQEWDLYTRHHWQNSARPYSYIYLDPDNRRPLIQAGPRQAIPERISQKDNDTNAEPIISGIRDELRFLGGAVSTGRNYELYNVLRGGDWTSPSYDVTCLLVDAVTSEANRAGRCTTKLNPSVDTCQRLLKNKLDLGYKLKPAEREISAACLLQEAQKLELVYYGYEGVGLTSKAITNSRQQLLKRLQLLAKESGLPQWALSIAALKADKLGDRRILLTRRFAPITGAMLGAFGAFIDRSFREYDYYAGIYDAIFGLADFYCMRGKDYQACLSAETKKIYLKLGVPQAVDADTVFYLLATHEHPDYQKSTSPWQWLTGYTSSTQQDRNNNLSIIFAALTRHFDPERNTIYEEPEFTDLIQTLFRNGYDVSHSSQFMQRIYRLKSKDPKTWYYPLTSRISVRMLQLEKESTDEYASLIRGAMGLGAFAVHAFIEDEESKLLIRSAAPADTWHNWLPYEIGADLRNGGLVVSWLPGIKLTDNYSLDLKITPAHLNRFSGDSIWFSQFDLFLNYSRGGLISSFGIGPTYTYTWKNWPEAKQNNVGASMYVAFLEDKLRLSMGQRSFDDDDFAGESIYLSISVMDVPGFAYWLIQGK